ncbi:MAG: RES family NAD+ phosphorylase [Saprospiraceae bacterium]|nr:RES family NAD+ phosphorylase [Saprospiraceae bacterium]
MECFRIAQAQYARDLTGTGARLYGGRWNSEGHRAIYAASYRSLALLEVLVHLDLNSLQERVYEMAILSLSVQASKSMTKLETKDLPALWMQPENQSLTQKLGDQFLMENLTLLLQVPSAIMPEEYNYIINPMHPLMKEVNISNIRTLNLDQRLIKQTKM